jgi:hypothetical protein
MPLSPIAESQMQQCIHCGKVIRRGLRQCPHCREAQAEARPHSASPRIQTGSQFRSGLLLMLLAAAAQYFAGGYSPLSLPGDITSPVLTYLVPVLFVCGLAMSLWGVFRRMRA